MAEVKAKVAAEQEEHAGGHPTADIQSEAGEKQRGNEGKVEDKEVVDEQERDKMEDEMKAKMKTKGIDKDLLVDHLKSLYTFKVLLLGAGETGKSEEYSTWVRWVENLPVSGTIVKQLKNIHRFRMKEADLDHISLSLHQNTVDCMRSLLTALEPYGLQNTIDEDLQSITVTKANHSVDLMI